MALLRRVGIAALGAALTAAVPGLAAQQPALVIGVYGGGYTHLSNLNANTLRPDFNPGYNLGLTVGFQLSPAVSLHSDFTFARSQARGPASFAGSYLNRMLVGAHLELATALGLGVRGYAFAGGGMVQVRDDAPRVFAAFWNPAAMGGLGAFVNIPHTNLDVMVEGKVLGYKFDRAGFNRMQWDATSAVGLAYRFALP